MLGLTPALLAQFRPMNTIAWDTPPTSFPNPRAPGPHGAQHINMKFAAKGGGQPAISWTGPTLLDSGTPFYNLHTETIAHSRTLNQGSNADYFRYVKRSFAAQHHGVQKRIFPVFGTYSVAVGNGSNFDTIGIGFFLQNSVLFNLSGQAVGYTPNFVTDTNILTTAATPLVIGSNSVLSALAGFFPGPAASRSHPVAGDAQWSKHLHGRDLDRLRSIGARGSGRHRKLERCRHHRRRHIRYFHHDGGSGDQVAFGGPQWPGFARRPDFNIDGSEWNIRRHDVGNWGTRT